MCHLDIKILFLSFWPPSYVISGGECHEDAVNELVKEGEMGAEEETQKTKGTKRKAESILARWCCPQGPEVRGCDTAIQIAGIGLMTDFLLLELLTFSHWGKYLVTF